MDDRVKAEYDKILTTAIIKNGSLVAKDASFYGWNTGEEYGGDFRSPRHSVVCGIAKTGRVEEDATWDEFMGTFYEGDTRKHGMEVYGVTCNCGKLKNRTFRWDAPVGEAVKAVVEELLLRSMSDE